MARKIASSSSPAVLGVDHRHTAPLGQNVHPPDQLVVVRVPSLFEVCQEEFEGAHAQRHHLWDLRHLPGSLEHATVETKIEAGLGQSILQHLLHFLQQAVAGAGIGKVQQGGGAAVGRDPRAVPHVVQVDWVNVGIDDAREDVPAGDVHHVASRLTGQVGPDSGDQLALHAHVGTAYPLSRDDGAAGQQ
jgi:hypothetical protein